MERTARIVLYAVIVLVPLLVVRGPMFGFSVPRVVLIAITAPAIAALTVPQLVAWWAERSELTRLVVALSWAFGGWVVLATLLSDTPMLSTLGPDSRFVGTVAIAFPIAMVAAIPVLTRTDVQVDRLLLVFTAPMAAVTAYSVIQALGLDPMPWGASRWGRPVGTFGNSNFVGAMLAVCIPLALWLWFAPRRAIVWWRLGAVALAGGTMFALWFAEARLGWVAAASGAIGFAMTLPRTPLRRVQGALIAAVPVATPLAGIAVVTFAFTVLSDRTALARQGYWSAALPMWADNAVVGVGVGRFQAFHRIYRPTDAVIEHGRDATVDSSHAFLIDLAATTGTPGVLLWLAMLVACGLLLRSAWLAADTRAQRTRVALMVGLLAAHGMQSSISVPIPSTVWLGWLVVGLAVAVASLEQTVDDDGEPIEAGAGQRAGSRRASGGAAGRGRGGRGPGGRGARGARGGRGRAGSRRGSRGGLPQEPAPLRPIERVSLWTASLATLVVLVPAGGVWLSAWDLGDSTKFRASNELDEAGRVTEAASNRTSWWPRTWDEQAAVAMLRGRQDIAYASNTASLEADPRNRLALRQMIRISAWIDGPDASAPWYEALREVDPRGYDLHTQMAEWAIETGRYELAEEAIEVAAQAVTPSMSQWRRIERLRDDLEEARGVA